MAPRRQKKNKQQKLGDMMSHFEQVYAQTALMNQPKIVDQKSNNHFGILLSTQQAIEEFQFKSGMRKAFTTEYQFHYWALVARIKIEEEILDIAIPTVMFNYNQEVNGAAVDFHLNDVETASNQNAAVAEIIANVLIASSFGAFLQETFKEVEWINVPMNTCHVHPGLLSTFSGTDYSKTINDPGICFPLSEPQGQPSFSSIVCHSTTDGNIGKVVRTEYRYANKEGNDIVYNHGTCLAYWKGHVVKGYKNKISPIKALFSNKEFDIKEDVEKAAYLNTDGNSIVLEGNLLINEIIHQFNLIEFSPHTEDILADRIVSMKTKFGGKVYTNNYYSGHGHYSNPHKEEIIPILEDKSKFKEITGNMTLVALRNCLIEAGYTASTVYTWQWNKCKDMYDALCDTQKIITSTKPKPELDADMDCDPNKMTPDEMLHYLLDVGYKAEALRGKSLQEIEYLFDAAMEELQELAEESLIKKNEPTFPTTGTVFTDSNFDFKNNIRVRKFLNDAGLNDFQIDMMDNDAIAATLEDLNW